MSRHRPVRFILSCADTRIIFPNTVACPVELPCFEHRRLLTPNGLLPQYKSVFCPLGTLLSHFSKSWRLRLHRSFHGACLLDHRVTVLLHVLVRCPERVELLNLFRMLFGDFRSGVDFRNKVEP